VSIKLSNQPVCNWRGWGAERSETDSEERAARRAQRSGVNVCLVFAWAAFAFDGGAGVIF